MKLFSQVFSIALFLSAASPAIPSASGSRLDSLFNNYVALKSRVMPAAVRESPAFKISSETGVPSKCSTGLIKEVKNSYSLFSSDQQAILKKLEGRPESDTSFVTPKGYFRIHTVKNSSGSPKYNMPEFMAALDSVYEIETKNFGFPAPPGDGISGGDSLFDIYIKNFNGDSYGYTETEMSLTSHTSTTFIVIDNDYSAAERYSTTGITAARVTVAHEFNHAIQMGNYQDNYNDNNSFFFEMTSTSMESLVFPYITDYLQYAKSFFKNPGEAFYKHDGYDLAVWNLFLAGKFGVPVIKRQWELFVSNSVIGSINQSLTENAASFPAMYNEFGVWCYYTNYRAVAGSYFKDAALMPLISKAYSSDFYSPQQNVTLSVTPISNSYILFTNGNNMTDSLTAIITCADVSLAGSSPDNTQSAQYTLYDSKKSGSSLFAGNYYYKLAIPSSASAAVARIFNNEVVNDTTKSNEITDAPFPSPFHYNRQSSVIYLPVASGKDADAEYFIYTPSMHLACKGSGTIGIVQHKYMLKWDGLDENGHRLNNGVYIAVTNHSSNIKKCKIAIFND
jgi:hypothetical protein